MRNGTLSGDTEHRDAGAGLRVFGDIFVINLKSRPDRRRAMAAELAAIGLGPQDVTWFDAVRPEDPGGFESIGARGCFLSQLGVLRAAQERGAQGVLILEDDVAFAPGFGPRVAAITRDLAATEWDMFYGGGVAAQTQRHSAALVRIDREVPIQLAHCVAVRGGAISRVAAYLEAQLGRPPGDPAGGPMHVDGSYSWARRELGLATFMSDPELCYQRPSRSSIYEKKRWRSSALGAQVADRLFAVKSAAKKGLKTLRHATRTVRR